MCLIPTYTKTERRARPGTLALRSSQDPLTCPARRLKAFFGLLSSQFCLQATDPVFLSLRPLCGRAISSQALQDRLQKGLAECGGSKGETVHGVRRGAVQAALQGGASASDVALSTGIRTEGILWKNADQGRHLPLPQS
jgi:hypothetical protein